MKMLMISLAGAALIATPAAAGMQSGGQATAAQAKDKDDPNRMICRAIESTGSRLRKERQCMTAAEWAVHNAESRRDIERGQSNRPLNAPGG